MEGAPAGSTGDIVSTPASRRCDNCGAPLRFEPASADLRCRHCRGAEPVQPPVDPGDPGPAEQDYLATVGDRASTDDDLEPVRLQCADCGAPSDYPPNTLAASCPYCRTPFVGAPTSTRTVVPIGVIPLTVTEDQARTNTKAWLGNRWFAPRHLDKVATGALRSGYTPAFVFSMSSTAAYRGRRGDNYLDTETYTTTDANGNRSTHIRTVTKIRWRSASGSVQVNFRGVTAFAGTDPLSRFGEDLEPFQVDEVEPFREDFLRGTTAHTYTKPPAAGLQRARDRTQDAVEDAIRADIGGDHQEIHDVDRRDRDIGFRYLLLPGWEATYRHRDDTYQLAVNGRSGEVAGTRPYSKVKIALAVGAAVAVIALIVLLVMRANSSQPTTPSGPGPTTTLVVPTTRPPTPTSPTTGAPTSVAPPSTAPASTAPDPVEQPAPTSTPTTVTTVTTVTTDATAALRRRPARAP